MAIEITIEHADVVMSRQQKKNAEINSKWTEKSIVEKKKDDLKNVAILWRAYISHITAQLKICQSTQLHLISSKLEGCAFSLWHLKRFLITLTWYLHFPSYSFFFLGRCLVMSRFRYMLCGSHFQNTQNNSYSNCRYKFFKKKTITIYLCRKGRNLQNKFVEAINIYSIGILKRIKDLHDTHITEK